MSPRSIARQIFLTALERCTVEAAFSRHIEYTSRTLRVCEDLYSLQRYSRVFVLAFGKAANAMTQSLVRRIGSSTGIVACLSEPPSLVNGFRYFRGGHPVPNEESIAAARAALRALSGLT